MSSSIRGTAEAPFPSTAEGNGGRRTGAGPHVGAYCIRPGGAARQESRPPYGAGDHPGARYLAALLALLIALLLPLTALAAPPQDAPISIEADLINAPSGLRLGDRVTLRITVTHSAQLTIRFPDPQTLESSGLEVLDARYRQVPASENTVLSTADYTLLGLRPQRFTIPREALQVAYHAPDGSTGALAPAGPVELDVESVLEPAGETSLRDIRPPVELPSPPAAPQAVARLVLALATALLLALLAHRVLLARPRAAALQRTPARRARAALAAAGALLAGPSPDYREFYDRLAAAVRIYLAERARLPALSRTPRELKAVLASPGAQHWPADQIVRLLDACDTARWSRRPSAPKDAEAMLAEACDLIDLVEAAERRSAAAGFSRLEPAASNGLKGATSVEGSP